MRSRRSRALPYLVSILAGLATFSANAKAQVDYLETYTERSAHTNFNVEVTRGMTVESENGVATGLYAIHSYQSTLVYYNLLFTLDGVVQARNRWRTVTDPVALALHGDYVYVLGQGSNALAKHDKSTGDIVDLLLLSSQPHGSGSSILDQRLGTEPADLVIDTSGPSPMAYVSLMGADAVVQISLSGSMSITDRWTAPYVTTHTDFRLKRPRFLSLDGNGSLYVAPSLSGNNSFSIRDTGNFGDGYDELTTLDVDDIHSGYDDPDMQLGSSAPFVEGGLPDMDIFRIETATGMAYPVVRGIGSIVTAHGVDSSNNLWALGINSLNVTRDTEPDLKGDFAKNVLSITPTSFFPMVPNLNPLIARHILPNRPEVDLDLVAGSYSPTTSVPFPYALELDGPNGVAVVGSSTLSRVLFLETGLVRHYYDLPLPPAQHGGLVIRDLEFVEGDKLYIYCQETSNIVVFALDPATGLPTGSVPYSFDLGNDPTPESIADGRRIFYDASKSALNRFSCATCHPGGESDLLPWDLKDGNGDHKDPMITQTLKGLRETFPYHWRGERRLEDFNEAFVGLLGNDAELEPEDLAAFEDFIFSLRPAANPHERIDRKMPLQFKQAAAPSSGVTATGQFAFLRSKPDCTSCHPLPSGGNGVAHTDNNISELLTVSTNVSIETIQLSNFLQAREQPLVDVVVERTINGTTDEITIQRSLTGTGFRHNGAESSLHDFLKNQFDDPMELGNDVINTTSFIQAMDTGVPPAAHAAALWSQGGDMDSQDLIEEMVAQADNDELDVIAFGMSPTNTAGVMSRMNWKYDQVSSMFLPDSTLASPQTLASMLSFSGAPTKSLTFVGLPYGLGERLGRNFDGDEILNIDESHPDYAWEAHQFSPDLLDGHSPSDTTGPQIQNLEILPHMTTGRLAIVQFQTDEPATWTLTATPVAGGDPVTSSGSALGITHTAHVHGLLPSWSDNKTIPVGGGPGVNGLPVEYSLELTVRDELGYATTDTFLTGADLSSGEAASANPGLLVNVSQHTLSDPVIYTATGIGPVAKFAATLELERRTNSPAATIPDDFVILAQVQRRANSTAPWVPVIPSELISVSATNQTGGVINEPQVTFSGTTSGAAPGSQIYSGAVDYIDVVGDNSGPLLALPPTGSAGHFPGWTSLVFQVSGIVSGEEISLRVIGIASPPSPYTVPTSPVFTSVEVGVWSMPETTPEKRRSVKEIP